MGTLKRVAPIFSVRDLSAALAHYQRLGFATRAYEGGGYGYATADGVEIHLGLAPEAEARGSASSSSMTPMSWRAWQSAGGRPACRWTLSGVHSAHVDPDGNVFDSARR
jgi:hypothetical protein